MERTVTPRKPKPTFTFTIDRAAWQSLLSDVLPFTGDDLTLPLLTAIQVEFAGKRITMRATDRFALGKVWWEHDTEIGAAKVMLPASDARAMAKLHPAHARGLPQKELTITVNPGPALGQHWYTQPKDIEAGTITITSGGVFDPKVTSEHRVFNGDFVDCDKLIPEEFTGTPQIGWNPDFMDKFRRVSRDRHKPVRVRFAGAYRPIRVDIGDRFTGILMPAMLPKEAS